MPFFFLLFVSRLFIACLSHCSPARPSSLIFFFPLSFIQPALRRSARRGGEKITGRADYSPPRAVRDGGDARSRGDGCGGTGSERGWGGVADCISSTVNHVSGVASRHSSDVSQLLQLSGSACVRACARGWVCVFKRRSSPDSYLSCRSSKTSLIRE